MRPCSRIVMALGASVVLVAMPRGAVRVLAQAPNRPALQLEVGDSIGLPLPNAGVEIYEYAEGGRFREWIPIDPESLGDGIHLLRFSHEGYQPSVFSVPIRRNARVSLRVRLLPETATSAKPTAIEATEVRAIGLELAGRQARDIIGGRRVLDRADMDLATGRPITEILQAAKGSGLTVLPFSAGASEVSARRGSGRGLCAEAVILNGDPTLRLSFSRFEQLYRTSEAEAIEIVVRGRAIPYAFRKSDSDCTVLLIWLTGR